MKIDLFSVFGIFGIVLFSIQGIFVGLLSSYIADTKGYSSLSWFFAGLFFNIFGLITIADMPMKSQIIEKDKLKECPDCMELIKIEALICRYCGKRFTKDEIDILLSDKRRKDLGYREGIKTTEEK